MSQIKVLIVDDSAVVRKVMTDILSADEQIQVIGQARDPIYAMEKIQKQRPDVITLDIQMPRMDGITFLKKIMSEDPIPVVICSSFAQNGSHFVIDAIKAGAVEIITKPKLGVKGFLQETVNEITRAVKAAATARVHKRQLSKLQPTPKNSADVILKKSTQLTSQVTEKVIAMGASTGGTQALRQVLQAMPEDAPGIVVVQHMPKNFTQAFAQHLDEITPLQVSEAKHGEHLHPGKVLVAPGGQHLLLKRNGQQYHVEVIDGPTVCRHRPSVDVLFRSVARYAGQNAVGCLMTGMGDDGAQGLLEMRQAGAVTYAQDEKSSVVFGMPHEAWKNGAAMRLISLDDIPQVLMDACALTTTEKVGKHDGDSKDGYGRCPKKCL